MTADRRTMRPPAILVVDDDPMVVQCVAAILKKAGFHVLSACSPGAAIEIESAYPGEIHLLLSDVTMPDMNGTELAATLTARRREMRVLLMSGCDESHRPSLQPGWRFVPKPFRARDLAGVVSDTLSVEGFDLSAGSEIATGRQRSIVSAMDAAEYLHV